MAQNLKEKVVNSIFWSFIETFTKQGVNFLVGIILARLLHPELFGFIAIILVIISVSNSLIDSGFSQALIQKRDCSEADFSTIFYFNIIVSIIFVILLYYIAPFISSFFQEPKLIIPIRIISIVLIIDSLSMVQRTILIKEINFKLQTKISIIADVVSGVIAIYMAMNNWGIWSLIARYMIARLLYTIFIWVWSKWKPSLVFSLSSFKALFSYGSKLLISGLIGTIFENIYVFVIGKFFSVTQLAFYNQANRFRKLPSQTLMGSIQRVTFPLLVQLNHDKDKLKDFYTKILKIVTYISSILMLGLGSIAEPLILTVLGEKWSQAIDYLQLLVIIGMLYPLHSLNLNMLNVLGHSDKFLQLEIIKRILSIPVIIIGIWFGIKILIIGMIANSLICFFLNSYWSGKNIGYSSWNQIIDIIPYIILSGSMSIIIYIFGAYSNFAPFVDLLLRTSIGFIYILVLSEVFKFQEYIRIKNIVLQKIKS